MLEERNNFLIESKRATKSLNNNGTNFDPHNAITDKYNKFEEKSILCQFKCDLNYKLLNLEKIYSISKKYEYSLDCLSFTNDSNAIEHINDANYQTHSINTISHKIIIDTIYPKINNIKYQQLIINYKYLLNQINNEYKIYIIQSIYYLITEKMPTTNKSQQQQQQIINNYANPRLLLTSSSSNNNNLNTSSNIQDKELFSCRLLPDIGV